MGFAGMSVDVGYLEYHQRQQQSAADAAAVGGAQQLISSGCGSSAAAQTAADNDAASNGFTNGAKNVVVTVNNPPAAGPYAANNCAVSVQVSASSVPTFFTRLFGFNGAESTQAVGLVVNNDSGCLFLLNQSDTLQLNGTNMTAPSCGILANSSLVQTNGGAVDVGSLGYAHSLQDNGTDFSNAAATKMLPVADPCPEIPGCAYLAAHPPAATGCTSFVNLGGNATIQPGCYSSFQNDGGTVTMASGTYVFTGVVQQNGGSLVGSGVTLYVTSTGGPLQLNGSGVTLSAPTTGNYANVLFYQVPSNTTVAQFNGGTTSLSGLVYAPGALGQVNGNGGSYVVLVFADMQFNGSNSLDLGGPVAGHSIIKSVVLGQ